MNAQRRLKELKRDALLHKIKDLQKRKASSKDKGEYDESFCKIMINYYVHYYQLE